MTVMAFHNSEMDTLSPTEFSYTRCTDLHSTMAGNAVCVPQTVYKTWEARKKFYTRSTTLNDPHGNSPLRNEHTAVSKVSCTGPYVSHRVCTKNGRSSSTLYTTYRTLNNPHCNSPLRINTLSTIDCSYTCCTDLFSTMVENAVSLPKAVFKIWEIPWARQLGLNKCTQVSSVLL